MATSGRGSGLVGYNLQIAVETEHHLIVAHEVTNEGHDRAHLANMAAKAKEALGVDELDAVADRGYFDSLEILACEQAGVIVTPPKPITSGSVAKGRFGKQDTSILCVPIGALRGAKKRVRARPTAQNNESLEDGAGTGLPISFSRSQDPVRSNRPAKAPLFLLTPTM